jgi:glutathione S-transferase
VSAARLPVLVGRYISPAVRRVAACMVFQEVAFEHRSLSTADPAEFAEIRRIAPLGRVPALVLPDGEVLVESSAILDHVDETVPANRALLPHHGSPRRQALQRLALATGVCDKLVAIGYEMTRRPADKRYQPWIDQCGSQALGGLTALEAAMDKAPWVAGDRITQGDFAAAVALDLAAKVTPAALEAVALPGLRRLRSSPEISQVLSRVLP